MRLADLEQFSTITIQCHDNPDADTIGAGYALYCYFKSKHKKVRLIYSGNNRIKKKNLLLMKEKLNIPIKYIHPKREEGVEGLLLTVDCQYGAGNVRKLPADLNFLPQLLRIHPAASDCSESSRLRAGRRKGTGRNVGHSALNHRISGSKNFIQHFHFYSLFPVLRAGETRHPSGKSRLPR